MSKKILIVDDEETIRMSLVEALSGEGYDVAAAESGEEALARIHGGSFDLVVTDQRLPGVSGLDILQALRNQGHATPVIMMTAYGDVDTAVAAMRLGAYDFIPKPFKLGTMKKQVRSALRATRDSVATATEDPPAAAPSEERLEGRSLAMIADCPGLAGVERILRKIGGSRSGSDTSILIQGESGSGKELVARAVHEVSGTRGEPFMEINCAAVPETLLESELFGYEKGAFTDAKARKEGLFELAGRGTIFLDEIGEMGILLQSRLLRVLENRRFRRVGGKEELTVAARIVAATNRRLSEAIERGAFRNDLYYRLQVVEIDVPPLRERPQDVEILANRFIAEFDEQLGLHTEPVSPTLLEMLQRYPWPGNVRELKNVLKRILILEEPARLEPEHFPLYIRDGRNPRSAGASRAAAGVSAGLVPVADVEKHHILYVLEMTQNNKSKAARILGISRQTLREKLRLYMAQDAGGSDELRADGAEA
jgi:DNA-binding NtrC family response regulator